ncbi:MAG: Crp/Fnr family transcriptional regulator [Geminicoccaceae bacterium]|nr:Crp/Fnr family transcriptional regulator [Geminicoccaceae bacterium]
MGPKERQALARIDLFHDLDPAVLAQVERLVTVRRFAAGQTVVTHRDDGREAFLILEGTLRITLFSPAGREVSYRDQKAGSSLGELPAIDGEPRSASVVALTDASVGVMTAANFRHVLHAYPSVALAELQKLTHLIRLLTHRIYWLSTPVPTRICAELRDLARENMIGPNVARLAPAPKHADIANRLATHREAVSRVLSQLKRAGIARRGRGEILVLDVERLARRADPDDEEL